MSTRHAQKGILPFFCLTLLIFFPGVPHAQGRFLIEGEIRERGLYSHGYSSLLGPDQKGTFFVGQRTRLNFSYENQRLGFFVQLEDGRVWGETAGENSQGFGIGQAYFTLDFGKGFGMKIGRMALEYEDNRYISYSSWGEIPDKHDALLFNFRSKDQRTRIDLLGSFSNSSLNSILNPYHLDDYFKYLAVAYLSHSFNPDFRWSLLSATHMNEALADDGQGGQTKDPSRLKAITALASYFEICPDRKLSALVYAYGQWGQEADSRKHSAMLASAMLTYRIIPQLDLKVSYDYLSGNNYREMIENGTEATHNHAFDKFLGSTHSFLGIMDYFGGSSDPTQGTGLHQPCLALDYRPAKNHGIELSARYFWSVHPFYQDPEANSRPALYELDRNLGLEMALVYKYKIHRDVKLEAGYAFHTSTPTLEFLNGIAAGRSKFSQFGYVMLEYKPVLFDSHRYEKRKK